MRCCFIINPNSRSQRGRAIWEEVQKELEKSQIKYEIYLTERRKNVTAIAAMLTADQEEKTLVVLGGDGTVNEVLNGIQNFENVILGYIPTGSSNDFARGMKIPKDPVKALHLVLHPQAIQKMDIGVVDYGEKSRRFAVSAGIGFDAIICHQASVSKLKAALNKIRLGKLTYAGIAIDRLIKDDSVRAEVELDKGETQVFRDTYFVAVQNQPYEGGGFKFCPEADPGDRKLDVIVVSGLKRWQVIRTLLLAFQGKHVGHKGISIFRCEEVKIRFSQARAVHTDGEAVFLKKEIRMHILPQQVRVITS